MAQSIRNCGPLRYTWVFPFERGNLLATRSIHRRDRAYKPLLLFSCDKEPLEDIARSAGLRTSIVTVRLRGPIERIMTTELQRVCVSRFMCN